MDGNGNVYVTDGGLKTVVKLDRDGVKDVSFPAWGVTFSDPRGVAVDRRTNDAYVADHGAKKVVKLDSDGNQVDFAGDVTFSGLTDVAVGGNGYVYVVETLARKRSCS